MNFRKWVLINLKIGALSLGGAGRLLMFEDEIVVRAKWLTVEEFREMLTIAQALPGPNLVNMCGYLGYALGGIPSAILGILALCLPGAIAAVLVWKGLANFPPRTQSFLDGCLIGNIALLSAFLVRLAPGLRSDVAGKAPRRRVIGRWVLAILITTLSLEGVSLFALIGVGVGLGFLFEAAL